MPTRRVLQLNHLSCPLRSKRSRTLFWSKSLQSMVLAPPEDDKDEGRKTVQYKYPVRSSPTLGLHASLLVSHKYHSLQTSPLRQHLICSHFLFSCPWSPIMSHYQVKEDEPENPALWLLLRSQVTRQRRGCISPGLDSELCPQPGTDSSGPRMSIKGPRGICSVGLMLFIGSETRGAPVVSFHVA